VSDSRRAAHNNILDAVLIERLKKRLKIRHLLAAGSSRPAAQLVSESGVRHGLLKPFCHRELQIGAQQRAVNSRL
jgi:hypothetical protein